MRNRYALKRLSIALIVTCLIGVMSLCACSTRGSSTPEEQAASSEPTYVVQIFVDCKENLFFSKYDVDVSVDGEAVGYVEHGSEETFVLSLTEGEHELLFEKEGASEPDGKVSFFVEGEADKFSYKIKCTRDQIEIETIEDDEENQSDSERGESATEKDTSGNGRQAEPEDEEAIQERLVEDLKSCEGKMASEGRALAEKAGFSYNFLDVNSFDVTSKVKDSSNGSDDVRNAKIVSVDVHEGFANEVIFTIEYEDIDTKEKMEQEEREAAGEFYFLKGKTAIEAREYVYENHYSDVVPKFYHTEEGLFSPQDIDITGEAIMEDCEKSMSEAIVIRVVDVPKNEYGKHEVKFYLDRRLEED